MSTDTTAAIDQLCLACGMCCNGVLFRDVELQPADDPAKLKSLGLPVRTLKTQSKFPQPCAALQKDCRCRIYADRPSRCRQFECALLQGVIAGTLSTATALRKIQRARQLANKVRRLLAELGDEDEHLPLSARFRRTKNRVEENDLDDETADQVGDLALTAHELNMFLAAEFYPKETDGNA